MRQTGIKIPDCSNQRTKIVFMDVKLISKLISILAIYGL